MTSVGSRGRLTGPRDCEALPTFRGVDPVKFSEFRKRIEPKKPDLPNEFSDSMALDLDAVADLLRVSRNDAGHPTGHRIDEASAYINLQLFARYIEKMMKLRRWLQNGGRT
jgi:hypothetical protein